VGKLVVMLAVALGAATAANAGIAYKDFGNTRAYVHATMSSSGTSSSTSGTTTATTGATSGAASTPEIDPAGMLSGLTLLLGGLAVLRGRRKVW
jgi:hypothetical protein